MSYCRIGDKSDVYVFGSGEGRLECYPRNSMPQDAMLVTQDKNEMLNHLLRLKGRGYRVPNSAIERLRQECLASMLLGPDPEA